MSDKQKNLVDFNINAINIRRLRGVGIDDKMGENDERKVCVWIITRRLESRDWDFHRLRPGR